MLIPKLPFVSNSRILAPFARLSHTLILPSNDVAARYCPSSERAIAHVSPTLLPSTSVSALYSFQMGQLWRRESRTHNLGPFTPPPTILCCPYFDLAPETHTSGYLSISAYGGMVATQFMSIVECLKEGKVWLVRGVDLDGRRAGRGKDLRCCGAQRKDVCWMG